MYYPDWNAGFQEGCGGDLEAEAKSRRYKQRFSAQENRAEYLCIQ